MVFMFSYILFKRFAQSAGPGVTTEMLMTIDQVVAIKFGACSNYQTVARAPLMLVLEDAGIVMPLVRMNCK